MRQCIGLLLLVLGVLLAHRVEPGVTVESVTLARGTPALMFSPERPGGPTALLAHGVTASKETLFPLGEALALEGYTAYAIDLPGHGRSPLGFRPELNARTILAVADELGTVELYLGHSMGAYAGAQAWRQGFRPTRFLALGALPAPVTLLAGRWEEAVPLARLQASGWPLVVSPWSDHALEPYDPTLIRAVVPGPRSAWLWRLLGGALALVGAYLQNVRSRPWAVILAVILSAEPWLDASPHLARLPLQLGLAACFYLALRGAARLGLPRWVFPGASAWMVPLSLLMGMPFLALFTALGTLLLAMGALLGSDLGMAVFLGYALGQWIPRVF